MAESTVVRSKKDLTLTVQDSGASNTYSPTSWQGDFSYEAGLYNVVDILDNGALDNVRQGDEIPVSCSWTQNLTDPGDGTEFTIPDICEERGGWNSTATSTTNQQNDVFTQDVVVTVDGTAFGEADKSVTFSDMILRGSATFGYPASYAVSGRSATAIKPTVA